MHRRLRTDHPAPRVLLEADVRPLAQAHSAWSHGVERPADADADDAAGADEEDYASDGGAAARRAAAREAEARRREEELMRLLPEDRIKCVLAALLVSRLAK